MAFPHSHTSRWTWTWDIWDMELEVMGPAIRMNKSYIGNHHFYLLHSTKMPVLWTNSHRSTNILSSFSGPDALDAFASKNDLLNLD